MSGEPRLSGRALTIGWFALLRKLQPITDFAIMTPCRSPISISSRIIDLLTLPAREVRVANEDLGSA